jgi:hypothetical protein
MSKQMLLSKRSRSVAFSSLLLGWLVLNGSTPSFADDFKKRNGWNRASRYADGRNCRSEVRRDQRYYQQNNNYRRDAYYQRAGDYRTARYYQPYRSNNRAWSNNGYQAYNQGYNQAYNGNPYGDYNRERSTAESALIIAGSSGAGAAIGGLLGGTKGAAVGAITGGVAGLIYDRHTDNRH